VRYPIFGAAASPLIGPRQDQTRAQERIFGEYQSALIEAGSRSPAVILQEEAMGGDMQDARSPDLLDRGLGRVTTGQRSPGAYPVKPRTFKPAM
jgi:hypothetical protein